VVVLGHSLKFSLFHGTIYRAHRAAIFAIAQLSCLLNVYKRFFLNCHFIHFFLTFLKFFLNFNLSVFLHLWYTRCVDCTDAPVAPTNVTVSQGANSTLRVLWKVIDNSDF